MRTESSVFSVSWIPSEAIGGLPKLPLEMGVMHHDAPPPDHIDDLEALAEAGAFRFANHLQAWIEVENGRIVDHGQSGRGHIASTVLQLGSRRADFAPVAFPDLRPEPVVTETSVRFVQTSGGRTGLPAPRRVRRPPFVQIAAPTAWTTLALTLHADGSSEHEVVGASPFPRHWIYDTTGQLVAKTGTIDFREWYHSAFGPHTPWGDEDSPALVTAAETALERELSVAIMQKGPKPRVRGVPAGELLVEQGSPGDELFVLLDGVLVIEVDGQQLAEVGPGAVLGERALLEGGTRTSTLRAVTACKVAAASADVIDLDALSELRLGHRREEG